MYVYDICKILAALSHMYVSITESLDLHVLHMTQIDNTIRHVAHCVNRGADQNDGL